MIDINRNNYEEYFLDFLEGNLSPSEEDLLMSFLDKNSDLKEELELLNEFPEVRIEETFPEKSNLKKSENNIESNTDNFNELCIARIEGDLSKEASHEFDSFISENKKRKKEFELFTLTKVQADKSIIFENKHRIKKSVFGLFITKNRYSIISAAASIVIALALFTLIPKNTEHIPLNIAQIEKPNKQKEVQEEVKKEQMSKTQVAEVIKQEIIENTEPLDKNDNNIKENITDSAIVKQTMNYQQYEKIASLQIEVEYSSVDKSIVYPEYTIYQLVESDTKNKHFSVKSFIAGVINKEVFNRDRNEKIEMFDVAQASLNGINRITGSNMKLTRIYDENGKPNKTEFSSKLIAFSTPAKKD
jgi:hypothetical protein